MRGVLPVSKGHSCADKGEKQRWCNQARKTDHGRRLSPGPFHRCLHGKSCSRPWASPKSTDIAAQILPVIGKSLHTQLGNQLVNLLFTTNLTAFYANVLPPFLTQTLDRLDGVVACTPVGKGCMPVSLAQSLVVSLVWALLLGGISTYLFVKRDVRQ